MEIDERAVVGDGAHIVANLPYNVGTALLLRWLAGPWPPWWRSLTLMFQREVAERIVASAGGDHYGRLADRRAVAVRGADRAAGPPQRLHPAAQGRLGDRPPASRSPSPRASTRRSSNASPPPPSASAARCFARA